MVPFSKFSIKSGEAGKRYSVQQLLEEKKKHMKVSEHISYDT